MFTDFLLIQQWRLSKRECTHALAWVFLFTLVLGALVLWVDRPLILWFSSFADNSLLKTFFKVITKLGEPQAYIVLASLAYLYALGAAHKMWSYHLAIAQKYLVRCSVLLLSSTLLSGLIVFTLKNTVARARPRLFLEHGFFGVGEAFSYGAFNSFPSSHTSMAVVVALVIGHCFPRWRYWAYSAAVLVALSRFFLLKHYASDVVAGAVIAWASVSYLSARIRCVDC